MMNVLEYYHQALEKKGFQPDQAQLHAVQRLQVYYDEWVMFKRQRSHPVRRWLSKPDVPQGVYLWGGVGRGKSFLMDSFYSTVPVVRKTRVHFHEFMHGIHDMLNSLKDTSDPLNVVAKMLAKKYRLICFDEFHVSDIADAMILHRLLQGLFKYGVSFVMTSNYAPDELYPNGLHRDRILPAIELMKQKMDILNVDSGIDYRQRTLQKLKLYFTPATKETSQALAHAFDQLAEVPDEGNTIIIQRRRLKTIRKAGGIIWFDFSELCAGPRSQNDYLELAQRFHTVIVSDIPKMSAQQASEARRFTWLIDVLYDHKIKLICSAECSMYELYVEGVLANEFTRTLSRLEEMQSQEYLDQKKRATVNL